MHAIESFTISFVRFMNTSGDRVIAPLTLHWAL